VAGAIQIQVTKSSPGQPVALTGGFSRSCPGLITTNGGEVNNLEAIKNKEVARPLKILVPLIREEIELGYKAGIEHYRRAGEMLNEAKEQIPHGEWMAWVRRNFKDSSGNALSHVTAMRYMRLAETDQSNRRRPFSSLREMVEPSRPHRIVSPDWHEPVREAVNRVNVDRLAQEQQSREKESKLIHELGIKLIDIGYKVLATQLHPDRGGSPDAMARLNRVRDRLKAAI
jgi:hypothetical protein